MTAHLTVVPEQDTPAQGTAPARPGVWEPPVPLGETRQLPPFPVEALPAWLADHVRAVAEFTQTPLDLPGCIALSALATAAAGRTEVRIRPGYSEPTNLFVMAALPPGSRKSDVFKAMTRPLRSAEAELIEAARPRIEEAKLARKVAEREAKQAEEEATSTDPSSVTAATEATLHAQSIEIPHTPQLIADDITPEAAATMISQQGGRLAVLAPEGGIVATIAGRYSGAPNFDVFLRGHAGEALDVTRQNREGSKVERAHLTLGLVVQPVVLKNLGAIPEAHDKGLLGRFLYALPTSTVGSRKSRVEPVPAAVAEAYATRIRSLVHDYAHVSDPVPLEFTHAADEAMFDLQDHIEPRLAAQGEWAHITPWAAKYAGATARLTGLIHFADHLGRAGDHAVSGETFARGNQVGEYFLAHALAAFDHMGTDTNLADARTVLDWIGRTQPTSFTRRDVLNAHRRRFRTAEAIDPALSVLEDHGHILRTDPPARPGPGRKPGPIYWPHPTYRAPEDRP